MSEAKRCDRCGAFYEPDNKKYPEYTIVKDWRRVNGGLFSYDLCPGCSDLLTTFMRSYGFTTKSEEENNNAEPEEV